MKHFFARLFNSPVRASRLWLLERLLLLVLAIDVWTANLATAGRYDSGGFHVAHFPFLDALLPNPSIPLYVCLSIAVGILCVAALTLREIPRLLIGVIALLYTWGWAMSVLDSFQHHYLMSLLLAGLAIAPAATSASTGKHTRSGESKPTKENAPPISADKNDSAMTTFDAKAKLPRLVRAPAYHVVLWSIAVVYIYTGIAKFEPTWLSGEALQRVLLLPPGGEPPLDRPDRAAFFRSIFGPFGIEGPRLWWTLGHGVVATQLAIASGYLLAPFRDRQRSRWLSSLYFLPLMAALFFHVGAEEMHLRVGWFSWYMIGAALIAFLPGTMLDRVVSCSQSASLRDGVAPCPRPLLALTLLATFFYWQELAGFLWMSVAVLALIALTRLSELVRRIELRLKDRRPIVFGLALVGVVGLLLSAHTVDIPGAFIGALISLLVLGGLVILQRRRAGNHPTAQLAWGTLCAAVLLNTALDVRGVRWDFYRYYGGDLARRGQLEAALEVYEQANRYAPEGESRDEQIERIEGQLDAASGR